ncbi:hypothetical protein [Halorubrum lacusprofundi]
MSGGPATYWTHALKERLIDE